MTDDDQTLCVLRTPLLPCPRSRPFDPPTHPANKQAGSTSVRGYRPALAQRLGLILLFASAFPVVNAQIAQTPATEEQRRSSQAEAPDSQRQLQVPDVVRPGAVPLDAVSPLAVPTASHCSTLHRYAPDVPRQLSRARQLDGASDLPFDPLRFPRYPPVPDYLSGAFLNR